MVDRGAKKVVAPIRQIQQHEQTFPYGPSIPPSDIKDTSIISIQKKQLSNPYDSPPLFHTGIKIGTVREHEPILVEDVMLSGYQSQKSGNGSIKIITQDHDSLSKTRPNSVSAQRDDLFTWNSSWIL